MRYVVIANIGTPEPIIRLCDSFEDAASVYLEFLSYRTEVILTREVPLSIHTKTPHGELNFFLQPKEEKK